MKFNDFLSMAVSDSVNAYSSGVREDAQSVAEGLSRDVRGECPDCGRHLTWRNKGEDGRCAVCDDKAQAEAAGMLRTPERLRNWARTTRNVMALMGHEFQSDPGWLAASMAECQARINEWEAEADALEAKR